MEEIRKRIVKRDVELPNKEDAQKLAFVLDNVYTEEECKEFIRKTEEKGYIQALINAGYNREILDTRYRNSLRCIWDSHEITGDMLERIRAFLPGDFNGARLVGINERLRFLKYSPGNFFKFHMDGSYVREDNRKERSYLTVHLYLNDGYKGGSTTFLKFENAKHPRIDVMKGDVECKIKTGSILVFQHNILHEGSLLHDGIKYTVRSDVMYCLPQD